MKRRLLTFILCVIAAIAVWPLPNDSIVPSNNTLKPKFLYNVDALFFFDNREYKAPWQWDQTLLGISLAPEIGVGITDKQGGKHRLMAGVHYTQPMGGNWRDIRLSPVAYYQYRYKNFSMHLGSLPYKNRICPLPSFLRYDSLSYFYPNIQGALLQYESHLGYVEAMLDWRGLQRQDQREMFRIVINGEYIHSGFFRYSAGGMAQLNHKANYADGVMPHEGVADDAYVSPSISIDFAPPTPLDTLSLRASYIYGFQRYRKLSETYHVHGMLLELHLNWRWLGLKNTFYYGGNLMPLYYRFSTDLNQGDPFYRAPLYNRTDLYVRFINKSFVTCYFSWNMHYVKDGGLQHQQQFIARFSLEPLLKR